MDKFYQAIIDMCPAGRDPAEFAAELLTKGPGSRPTSRVIRNEMEAGRPPSAIRILQVSRALGAPPDWVFGGRTPSEAVSTRWLVAALALETPHIDGSIGILNAGQRALEAKGISVSRQSISNWISGSTAPPVAALRIIHDLVNPNGDNPDIVFPEWAPGELRRRTAVKHGPSGANARRSQTSRIDKVDLSNPLLRAEMAALGAGVSDPEELILKRLSEGPGAPPSPEVLRRELSGEAPIGQARVLQIMRAHGGAPSGVFAAQGGRLPDASEVICRAIAGHRAIGRDVWHDVWLSGKLKENGLSCRPHLIRTIIHGGLRPRRNRRQAIAAMFPEEFANAILDWTVTRSPMKPGKKRETRPPRSPDSYANGSRVARKLRAAALSEAGLGGIAGKLATALKLSSPSPETVITTLHGRLEELCDHPPSMRVVAAWCRQEATPNREEMELLAKAVRCQLGFLSGNRPYLPQIFTKSELRDAGSAISDRIRKAERFFGYLRHHLPDIRQVPENPLARLRLAVACRGQLPDPSPERNLFPAMRYMIGLRVAEGDTWLAGHEPPPAFIMHEIADMCGVEQCWMDGEALSEFSVIRHGIIPDLLEAP